MIVAIFMLFSAEAFSAALSCSEVFVTPATPDMSHVVAALQTLVGTPVGENFFEPTNTREDLTILQNPVYPFNERILESNTKPTYLGNKLSLMAGGVGFFHMNMFAEGNFRQQKVVKQNKNLKTSELARTETWFEWQPQKLVYAEHHGNAVTPLLEPYLIPKTRKVKLYRGLSIEEAKLFARLKKGETAMTGELLTARRDALFFTPDIEMAQKWGEHGRYIEMTFELSSLQKSYAGLEFDYVEVAIWQPEVLVEAISTLKVRIPKKIE